MKTDLGTLFTVFAQAECRTEPLYGTLCASSAHDPSILALLDVAPAMQRRPNLLLAAVHYLLLKGVAHPLARYYPSVGGTAAVDADCFAAFRDFCATHREPLRALIATRTTQTNEVGRCVVLLPILQQIAALRARPLALIDVGTSAGLNLGIDRYRYDYPAHALGNPDAAVTLRTQTIGPLPIPVTPHMPQIQSRIGIDIDPVDIFDDDQVLWLRACLWPNDTERAARFDAAVTTLRAQPPRVVQGDAVELMQLHAEQLARDACVVIVNSWVMTYFDAPLRARYSAAIERILRQHDAFWIAAEAPGVVTRAAIPPLPDQANGEMRNATLWSICYQSEDGLVDRTLARSHGHGAWVQWTAQHVLQ